MVLTTCISTGMIAIGAVLGNMPGISRTVSCAHHGRSAAWWRRGTSCRNVGQGTRTYVIMLCYRAPVVQALEAPTNTYPALGPVAVRHSSRASTCWMDCRTRSLCACRTVWSAAAWLPQQPYSRSGAWHAVTHPGHGGTGCARFDHQVGQA